MTPTQSRNQYRRRLFGLGAIAAVVGTFTFRDKGSAETAPRAVVEPGKRRVRDLPPLFYFPSNVYFDNFHDDSDAITSYLNSGVIPDGGTIVVPGMALISRTLTVPRSYNFLGLGWSAPEYGAQFGGAGWSKALGSGFNFDVAGNAGIVYNVDNGGLAGRFNSRMNLSGLIVKGPGIGRDIGVTIGGMPGTTGMLSGHWNDVLIGNFDVGLKLGGTQQSNFFGLRVRGCGSTGIMLADHLTNANSFFGGEIQDCERYGFLDVAGAAGNKFIGMLLQNCGSSSGIAFRCNGSSYLLEGCWFENIGAEWDISLAGPFNSILSNYMKIGIRFENGDASNCEVVGNKGNGAPSIHLVNHVPPPTANRIVNNANFTVIDDAISEGGLNDYGGGAMQSCTTDADLALAPTLLATAQTWNITSTLTADRNVVLATVNAVPGTEFMILNNTTGGHNLVVKVGTTTLKKFGSRNWGQFKYNGKTFVETGYGPL